MSVTSSASTPQIFASCLYSRFATRSKRAIIAAMAGSKRSRSFNCKARHSAKSRAKIPVGANDCNSGKILSSVSGEQTSSVFSVNQPLPSSFSASPRAITRSLSSSKASRICCSTDSDRDCGFAAHKSTAEKSPSYPVAPAPVIGFIEKSGSKSGSASRACS